MLNCTGIGLAPFINMTTTFNRTESLCDFDMSIGKVLNNLLVKVDTIILPRNTKLMGWNFEFCQHLQRDKNSLIHKIYEKVKKLGKMPVTCPITPNNYYMHQMDFNLMMYSTYMPIADVRITIKYFSKFNKSQVALGNMLWDLRLNERPQPVNSKGK